MLRPCFPADRICHGRLVQSGVVQVGIDLGRIEIAVAQDLLQGAGIDAVFEHQGRRRVPQLVGGVAACVQTGGQQLAFQHVLDPASRDPAILSADKKCIFV